MGGIPLGCEDCLRREHFSSAWGVRGAERQWGCSPWTLRGEAGPEGRGQGLGWQLTPRLPACPGPALRFPAPLLTSLHGTPVTLQLRAVTAARMEKCCEWQSCSELQTSFWEGGGLGGESNREAFSWR